MKYIICIIIFFTVSNLTAQTNRDSAVSIYEPYRFLDGNRIAITEEGVKKVIIDTTATLTKGQRIYFDTSENIIRVFQFAINGKYIKVETRLNNGILHGFYYLKKGRSQVFSLFDNGQAFCTASIKNGLIQFEHINNGNMLIKRLYDKRGDISYELITYDNCKSSRLYTKKEGFVVCKYITISNTCVKDMVEHFTFFNYPSFQWLKTFAGIDKDLFLNAFTSGH
jgi:hypothetical protein